MPSISEQERAKYHAIWSSERYKEHSPGEMLVDTFLSIAKPAPHSSVLDIGAGSGAAARAFKDGAALASSLRVSAFDLVDTAWTHDDIPLTVGTIWRDLKGDFDYGYCCDVMEHIPGQFTGLAISEMLRVCRRVFFSISFRTDVHGDCIRDRLHLTIQPFAWWVSNFKELGTLIEARDLIGDGIFYVSRR